MRLLVQERADLSDPMTQLLGLDSPIVSVYINTGSRSDETQDRMSRWGPLRSGLALQGVSIADLSALDRLVAEPARPDCALAAWAGGGRLRFTAELEGFAEPDLAVAGAWPHLLPYLRWQQRRVPEGQSRAPGLVPRPRSPLSASRPGAAGSVVVGIDAVRDAVGSSAAAQLLVGSPTDPGRADELVGLAMLANVPVSALRPDSRGSSDLDLAGLDLSALELGDGVGAVLAPARGRRAALGPAAAKRPPSDRPVSTLGSC